MSKAEIKLNSDVFAFFCNEAEQVHALCDKARVPRIVDGSEMSMAQRVAILEGAYRGLAVRVGMEPPSIEH